jgi:hypothetical protein
MAMINEAMSDMVPLSPETFGYFCRRDFLFLRGRIAGIGENTPFGAETLESQVIRLATLFVFAP